MGTLRRERSGESILLRARTLVGRAADAECRLTDSKTSGEHARISWRSDAWLLRDLASRNGTFVDGVRIEAGVDVPLVRGARLAFGDRDAIWVLDDDAPPRAVAYLLDGNVAQLEERGLLVLPDERRPEVVVFRDADGVWSIEQDDSVRRVRDREILFLEGSRWRLFLPVVAPATRLPGETPASVALEFRPSRDEEHIRLLAHFGGAEHDLGARAHNYALLTLARRRLADDGQPEAERGWVGCDALARELRIDREHLNLLVFRARKTYARAGLPDAAALFERRATPSRIRIGVARLAIVSPGEPVLGA